MKDFSTPTAIIIGAIYSMAINYQSLSEAFLNGIAGAIAGIMITAIYAYLKKKINSKGKGN